MRNIIIILSLLLLSAPAFKEPLTRLPDLHELRAAHSATLLPGGKVLITAGFKKGPDGHSQLYSNTAELYDPVTRTFSYTGKLHTARCGQAATLLPGGNVLITGGNNDKPSLASAELYNAATGTWSALPDMLTGREGHRAILLINGKVLIAGGTDSPDLYAELYDPSTQKFQKAGRAPLLFSGSSIVQLKDGRIFITGGYKGKDPVQYSMIYDPATNKFTRSADMGIVRNKMSAAPLSDGRVLVIGGSDKRDWNGTYASTEIYDPLRDKFTKGPRLNYRRFKVSNAVIPLRNGAVVVAGGDSHIEMLKPGDTAFSVSATLDQPYLNGTATLLPTGNILLAGGYNTEAQVAGKAWLYNPGIRSIPH